MQKSCIPILQQQNHYNQQQYHQCNHKHCKILLNYITKLKQQYQSKVKQSKCSCKPFYEQIFNNTKIIQLNQLDYKQQLLKLKRKYQSLWNFLEKFEADTDILACQNKKYQKRIQQLQEYINNQQESYIDSQNKNKKNIKINHNIKCHNSNLDSRQEIQSKRLSLLSNTNSDIKNKQQNMSSMKTRTSFLKRQYKNDDKLQNLQQINEAGEMLKKITKQSKDLITSNGFLRKCLQRRNQIQILRNTQINRFQQILLDI